jgi:glycosyltransferase involved in cell wall biosynthesis
VIPEFERSLSRGGTPRAPKVSICVPNLNARPFLPERFATIQCQSFHDWEALVYDSYSNDGSWEYIRDLAANDARIRAWQGPREGVYPAWNHCIRQAQGDYVYIATSDDTMASDCLEKLVSALERNPECDLAHCRLVYLDELGQEIPASERARWPDGTAFGLGLEHELDHEHIRRAPHDGLLHLTQLHAYLSITQLLIRRSLFARTGEFQAKWGSFSDFNWEMRAGRSPTSCMCRIPGPLGDCIHASSQPPLTFGRWSGIECSTT